MAQYPFSAYLKSLFYFVSFTGVGYVLLKLTEPGPEKLKKIRDSGATNQFNYEQQKTKLILDKIKATTSEKPVYLKSPAEIKRYNEQQQELQQQLHKQQQQK